MTFPLIALGIAAAIIFAVVAFFWLRFLFNEDVEDRGIKGVVIWFGGLAVILTICVLLAWGAGELIVKMV